LPTSLALNEAESGSGIVPRNASTLRLQPRASTEQAPFGIWRYAGNRRVAVPSRQEALSHEGLSDYDRNPTCATRIIRGRPCYAQVTAIRRYVISAIIIDSRRTVVRVGSLTMRRNSEILVIPEWKLTDYPPVPRF
jgi:hypothetical protein